MTKHTVTVRLEIDAHPAFSAGALLEDLRLQMAGLSEPEPRRKPHRLAWWVTESAVAFSEGTTPGTKEGQS